jgi:hypothetical protein
MNKFKMELTWHNCHFCPPKEDYNDNLYITSGQSVHRAEYSKDEGWYDFRIGDYINFEYLRGFWWADIEQTICRTSEFRWCTDD